MCESGSSSDENSNLARLNAIPHNSKLTPGAVLSLSRLQALELISRHRVKKHPPDPVYSVSGSEVDNYDVPILNEPRLDTDVKPVPNFIIKCEPGTSDSNGLKKDPGGQKKTKTCSIWNAKTKLKSEKTSNVKQESPTMKLGKSGAKGEWHIKKYVRYKYKKARKYQYPLSFCKYTGDSTRKLNEHYRSLHPPLPCSTCHRTFTSPSSLRLHSYLSFSR